MVTNEPLIEKLQVIILGLGSGKRALPQATASQEMATPPDTTSKNVNKAE